MSKAEATSCAGLQESELGQDQDCAERYIHQEILEKVRRASSIDTSWTLFRDKLCEAINEHIPTITIKESMRLPWVSTRLRRLGRRRDRASKRARRNELRLSVLARQLKHDHQRAMREAYWDFIDNLISTENEDHLLTDKRPPKQKRLFQYTSRAYGRNAQEYHP